MDKDVAASTVQKEQKDGFSQLAEKMEQVRTQMVNMERKYDELYKTVKEKEIRTPSQTKTSEEAKSGRESVAETPGTARPSVTTDSENKSAKPVEKPVEDASVPKPAVDPDIEKMEDNPFI